MRKPGLVVWFCGLPGSGKTTIATGVYEKVKAAKNPDGFTLVSMDSIRKRIFPDPIYSDEERNTAYRAFVLAGSLLSVNGVTVLLDAVGHKRKWRELARNECPRFVEVYVKCPIELCITRETNRIDPGSNVRKKLYLDALERLKTGKKEEGLGKVPGVDEPFEESESPEITIDSSIDKPKILVNKVLQELAKFDPEIFSLNPLVS
ncbi:MAG: adenylyl-sulfate kinase [Nitrososphaerales archaeon]